MVFNVLVSDDILSMGVYTLRYVKGVAMVCTLPVQEPNNVEYVSPMAWKQKKLTAGGV